MADRPSGADREDPGLHGPKRRHEEGLGQHAAADLQGMGHVGVFPVGRRGCWVGVDLPLRYRDVRKIVIPPCPRLCRERTGSSPSNKPWLYAVGVILACAALLTGFVILLIDRLVVIGVFYQAGTWIVIRDVWFQCTYYAFYL